ncbi:MAG: hypothetical protein KIS63_00315 [Caldilineales bacterium]|nr:hypothetical protein [Planctomycetales bacterium]MCW5856700.1 hypothetical protein [Caldilineales bacterium]
MSSSFNIFEIGASGLNAEDLFTASLGYLIDTHPDIGQGMFDMISIKAGLPRTAFESTVDHPPGDEESRPDFLLVGKDYDILCEHKLDAPLGERQLERYLALSQAYPRKTYVALITNNSLSVPKEAQSHKHYLRPNDSTIPYFTWDALYPIVAAHETRLAQEFAAYMRKLDMAPPLLPKTWEHLFVDGDTASAFYDLTNELRGYFKGKQARVQKDPGFLGFQVRYPNDWMHLLYFCVERSADSAYGLEGGPYLSIRLWLKNSERQRIDHLSHRVIDEVIQGVRVVGKCYPDVVARWDKTLVLGYECLTELSPFLMPDAALSRLRLLEYGKIIFTRLNEFAS